MKDSVEGVGFPSQILHYAAQTAFEVLSMDIKATGMKRFSNFSICMVQTEQLKDLGDFLATKLCSTLSCSLADTVENWSEVVQSCPTLCDPMDYSLSGSSAHGIFQATVLEWVAISFSRISSLPRDGTQVSPVLHCGQMLYPLSHQGSPVYLKH